MRLGGTDSHLLTEGTEAANAGEYAPGKVRGFLERFSRNWAVRLGLVSGAAYGAYEYVPAVHQAVDSLKTNVSDYWRSLPANTERFPIRLDQSSFTPVSLDEEAALWKNTKGADSDNYTLTLGFPVDQSTVDQSPNLRSKELFDAILSPFVNLEELQKKDVKNVESIAGLPKDALIFFRYDPNQFEVSAFLMKTAGETILGGYAGRDFTPAYTGVRLMLREKKTGQVYGISLSALWAKPLTDITPFPKGVRPTPETGTKIAPDKPILQLTSDMQFWDGQKGQVLPDEEGQLSMLGFAERQNPIDPSLPYPVPVSIQFLKTPQGDIAVLKE